MLNLFKKLLCVILAPVALAAAGGSRALAQSPGELLGMVWQDAPEVAELFTDFGLNGTFALYDPEKDLLLGCNEARAGTRYLPASTFKILNSLIAFETGVVKDAAEILPYGGGSQPVKAWERDMTIKEAIAVSNVPLYQGIARRIGLKRMADYVRRCAYGNAQIGDMAGTFWLKGPLRISALEEVRFLTKLTLGRLPFSPRSLALLREIMPREPGEKTDSVIFYKTGLAAAAEPPIAWVAGWVELGGKSYPFALNFDAVREADAAKRLPLMRKALSLLGLY